MSLSLAGRLRVVLCQTTHPGNIGGAARAMKTMGFGQLHLVAPRKFPDNTATAMATGASDLLDRALVTPDLATALVGSRFAVGLTARARDLSHPMHTLEEAAVRIAGELRHGPVALVFGTEMSGLSNDELDLCQALATIPADPAFSSLNLACAVQVACYEVRRALAAAEPAPSAPLRQTLRPQARSEDVEAFYRHLEQVLVASGFLDPAVPKRLMARLRRMFARARLETEEVNILRGILRALDERVRGR